MWVIISTSDQLKFYDLKNNEGIIIDGLYYFIKTRGHVPEIKFDHNKAVSTLLKWGIPLFMKKTDARKEAVNAKLTGFKYLKLNPSIIKFTT
ncbi:hypothetical protein [Moritella viscosa]|uniref:Putative orphan protein n=1 Tax=Moritella viscosa TaxID=80854 RepID=A0A1K9ZXH8_9GAMM|nr:hypothetical protein [Moritella viscosa]SGZ04064.1 Putative orphan protein [Moritella viscosa]